MININGMVDRRDVLPNTTSLAFQVQKSAEAEKLISIVKEYYLCVEMTDLTED
jgi:hypothetical protein